MGVHIIIVTVGVHITISSLFIILCVLLYIHSHCGCSYMFITSHKIYEYYIEC